MANLLAVGLGGFVGSVSRYLVAMGLQRWSGATVLPVGTLAVNVLGCLVIGLLGGLVESRAVLSAELRLFLMVGLLGGFTTFSTFGYETLALMRDAQMATALAYVGAHLLLGLVAVWLGFTLGMAR